MPTLADLRRNAKFSRGCAKIKRADFPGDTSEDREAAETLALAEEYTAGLLEWAAQEIEAKGLVLSWFTAGDGALVRRHIAAARAELAKRKEPHGLAAIVGKWQGDETDEALRGLRGGEDDAK